MIRRICAALCLLVAVGCAVDDAALEARLCSADGDCPPGRACLAGVCVRPDDGERHRICRGSALQVVQVTCDDYRCDAPRVEVLEEVDCAGPVPPMCNGDQSVRQRPGVCDAAEQRCVYPPPEITECAGTRRRCEGDLLVESSSTGCDPATGECVAERAEVDCRAELDTAAARCESSRYLEQPVLAGGLAACDPQTTRCRVPEMQRIDCGADVATCEGAELRVLRGGPCVSGACAYTAAEPVSCAEAPPDECDGDLLVRRAAGGICDPVAGACRYPEPVVEDCSRTRAECVGQISKVREAGACVAGACTMAETEFHCDEPGPDACAPGSAAARLVQAAGVCEPVSGRCVTPEPTIEPCEPRRRCADGVAVEIVPRSCEDGLCVGEATETICPAPSGYCRAGVAHNFDGPARCDAEGRRCAGADGPADRREPCPAELFCRDNVLFGPGDPNCVVSDGLARCVELPLLDCNRAPSPTCDGSRQITHVGPGQCNAVLGCRFGEALVTDCAACLPAGAICVLPGTVRIAPSTVDMGPPGAPLTARFAGPLVMTTTEVTRGEVALLIGQGRLPPILGRARPECPGDDCPATGLSWRDAVAIANARSVRDGLPPCYDPAGRVVGGADGDPHLCQGWRLPTEAEWLAAWRGRTATRWPCGDDAGCLADAGEHLDGEGPAPVGGGRASAAGLADLGGNAREWVHDVFADPTGGLDPYGPSDGDRRVLRGGSWRTGADGAAADARSGHSPAARIEDAGVRLARGLAPRPPQRCYVDPITEQAFSRRFVRRGECALTPGIPCAFGQEESRPCPEGCRAGRCLDEPDAIIDVLPSDPQPPLLVPLSFAAIPGGVFTHGPAGRRTTIAHDFWLMTTELTATNAGRLIGDGGFDAGHPAALLRARLGEVLERCVQDDPFACRTIPVFGLTWLDMIHLANALSAAEDRERCYDDDGAVIGGVGGDPQTCLGYRLPTEAEWVYAARAGATTAWTCGDDPTCLLQAARFALDSAVDIEDPADCPCHGEGCPLADGEDRCRYPGAVDGHPPNAWGLWGMTGNVAEWVADHDDGSGPAAGGRDPYRGPSNGSRPVLKGGAWFEYSDALRLDARAVPDGGVFPGVGAGGRLARTIPAAELPTARIPGGRSAGGVTVSGAFEVTVHEITQGAAAALGARFGPAFPGCGPDCPIELVDRADAARLANALSLRQGLQPCYTDDGAVRASAGDDPYRCEGWRLPTEAEWRVMGGPCDETCVAEGAWSLCSSALPPGAPVDEACWCDAQLTADARALCDDAPAPDPRCMAAAACFGPRPVGQRPADADGLYDRAGNVSEWLHDRWSAAPPAGVDPYGPDRAADGCGESACFVVVGGSWAELPTDPDRRRAQRRGDDRTGFRLVRSLTPGRQP